MKNSSKIFTQHQAGAKIKFNRQWMQKKLLILLQTKLKSSGTTSRTFSPALWQSTDRIREQNCPMGSKKYHLFFVMVSEFHILVSPKQNKNSRKETSTEL